VLNNNRKDTAGINEILEKREKKYRPINLQVIMVLVTCSRWLKTVLNNYSENC